MFVTLILTLSIAGAVTGQISSIPAELAVSDTEDSCYPRLGCFPGGSPYYGTPERLIGFKPWSPQKIDVRLLLFTRKNLDRYQVIRALNISLNSIHNDTEISGTNFDPKLKTVMIAHGFLEKGDKAWLVELCHTFLRVSDVNCVCVDWRNGSRALYTQASANIRVVGAEMSNFLRFLQAKYDYSMEDVLLVGHSLGGHVVGVAGMRQPGIGLIIGLDPAGPYFENTSPVVRLDPTDALLVVVLHTDGPHDAFHLGFGIKQNVGHIDIFPNGGKNMPGCQEIFISLESIDALFEGLHETLLCNHHMSYRYFNKSIEHPEGFVAYLAPSYGDFLKGSGFPCTDGSCVQLGYKADQYASSRGQNPATGQMFFLNTRDPPNFLCWRYKVSILITTEPKMLSGSLSVSLCAMDGCSNSSQIHSGSLNSGESYSSFINVDKDVNPVQKIQFVWNKGVPFILLPSAKVGVSTVTVQYGPTGETYKFCGTGDPTEQKTTQTLEKCSSTDPL